MPLLDWLRAGLPGRDAPPPDLAPAAPARVETLDLDARCLAEAWDEAAGRLTVRTGEPFQRGQRLLVRVRAAAGGSPLTLLAEVATVRREAGGWRAEAEPEPADLPALRRLLAAVAGRAPALRPRAPRHRASLPAVVTWAGGTTFMTTFSVSEGGCGLGWSGPPPRLGAGLHIRLGAGPRAASFRAMVCWHAEAARGHQVGLRFLAGQEAAWRSLLEGTLRAAPAR